MGTCDFCGKKVSLPFKCAYCGMSFCDEHRLPESHNCNQMVQSGKRRYIFRDVRVPASDDEDPARISAPKRSTSSMKALLLILLICSVALNLYLWDFRYSEGYEAGYSEGSTDGFQQGHTVGYQKGHTVGYQQGYEKGNSTGFHFGHQVGYNKGYNLGQEAGYEEGNSTGFAKGNETGYISGYNIGRNDGYDDGYLQGVEDGAGRGCTIRDPTYKETLQFTRKDKTDTMEYDPENFVCHDFVAMFKTNAFKAGYRCFYVYIKFPEASAHAIVGFNTTDKGFIFIEPQTDDIVSVAIGKPYWDRTKWQAPTYDDTIVDFDLIP